MRLALPFAVLMLLGGAAPADEAETGKCLPPSVGDVVATQLSGPALAGVLPPSWKAGAARVLAHRVEIEFSEGRTVHAVALVAGSVDADGHGPRFSYRVVQPASEADRAALLKIAGVIEAAIPESGILSCEARPRRNSRTHALIVGWGEIAALLAAVIYGVIRGRRVVP